MPNRDELVGAVDLHTGVALVLTVFVAGCEGDLPFRLMQRDLDSVKTEVAVVDRTHQGERAALEQRLEKLETDLKSNLEKAGQEKREDVEGFMRSQASLNTKLDDLIEEGRSTQGRLEEIGHRISELNTRLDALGSQVGQFGRRVDGVEKQLSQAAASAQEAKLTGQAAVTAAQEASALAQQAITAYQQTAQEVTKAFQQMAEQTNAAVQQVNATTQLALTEARKAVAAKQAVQPVVQRAPVVIKLPPPPSALPPAPATSLPPPPASPPQPATSAPTPGELYKNALNDYTRGKYDLAIDGFRSYIFLYPKTDLLPSAQYWLGESFYRRKDHGLAVRQFELFVTEYPKNPKVANALLKQGYAYLELGNTSQGRAVLNSLRKRYPKSQEAKLAKERLSQIKKGRGTGSGSQGPAKRTS